MGEEYRTHVMLLEVRVYFTYGYILIWSLLPVDSILCVTLLPELRDVLHASLSSTISICLPWEFLNSGRLV